MAEIHTNGRYNMQAIKPLYAKSPFPEFRGRGCGSISLHTAVEGLAPEKGYRWESEENLAGNMHL